MPPTAPPLKAECGRGGRAISSLQSPGGSAVVEDEGVLSPTRWRTGRRCYAPATASVALHHSLQLAVGASVTAVKAEAASEREARGRGPGCSSVGCGGFVSSGGGCGGGCGTYAPFYLFITVSKDPFIALRPAGRLSEDSASSTCARHSSRTQAVPLQHSLGGPYPRSPARCARHAQHPILGRRAASPPDQHHRPDRMGFHTK